MTGSRAASTIRSHFTFFSMTVSNRSA